MTLQQIKFYVYAGLTCLLSLSQQDLHYQPWLPLFLHSPLAKLVPTTSTNTLSTKSCHTIHVATLLC